MIVINNMNEAEMYLKYVKAMEELTIRNNLSLKSMADDLLFSTYVKGLVDGINYANDEQLKDSMLNKSAEGNEAQ